MVKIHKTLIVIIDWIYPRGTLICVDRKDCFDKRSKCPIQVRPPRNEHEVQLLDAKMSWLETPAGKKASAEYQMDKWMYKYDGDE